MYKRMKTKGDISHGKHNQISKGVDQPLLQGDFVQRSKSRLKSHIDIKTKAVIFDMDGVITNTMPDHFEAWRSVLSKRGIEVNHLDIYSREGQRGITSVKEIFDVYGHPFNETDAFNILKQKEELFKSRVITTSFIRGIRSFLKDLKKGGFVLAIVTGTARHEMRRILPDTIYNHFTVIVTGDDVVHGKPSPEPYLLALIKLGLQQEDAVVIENAPFGITAAKAAKLRCLAIETSLPREYLKQADHVFLSIKHLRDHIKFIQGPI